ncbi:MAG: isoprenylcysteine carboxylmethyltransferase family protein [Clostridiales bacterium]|nr:isoprenylcysteine carboxylmethyltransferase family protein [Clostridiales bacterium]
MFFQLAALAILVAFYGCYFGKMLRQKKQGIQTDQMGKGKHGKEKIIEVFLKIVTILVPVAEVTCILHNLGPLPFWVRIAGLLIASAGLAVFVLSVATMKDSWRAGVPNEGETGLVTDGIYRISRNPAFLGFDLVYVGILLTFFHWGLLAVTVAAVAMLHLQICFVEEPFLIRAFGVEYLEYQKKVCRYLGQKSE